MTAGMRDCQAVNPMDLLQWATLIAFEGIIGGISVLLSLTYVSFARMERDVRRARMFIMADRINRFLGAFTAGFLVLAVTFATGFLGITLPSVVGAGAFFFFLATIAYGIVELYFIVRPRRTVRAFGGKSWRPALRPSPKTSRAPVKPSEEDRDATS
jgi:hypothetical protein